MRTHILLFLGLAVAVSLPVQDWEPVENLVEDQRERNPLRADVLPEQGHVVQEDPQPVARKESFVLEKHAEQQPEQQSEQVNEKRLVEDVSAGKKAEAKEQSVMVEPRDKKRAPTEYVGNIPPLNEVPEMAEEELTAEKPVTGLETETEKTLVDVLQEGASKETEEKTNVIQEKALTEADEPVMELEPVPDMQEVLEMNPDAFPGDPVTELEPENQKESEEDERNVMPDGAEAESVMDLEPVPNMQEVHEMGPNYFAEEPGMELKPEKQKASEKEERNVMQEEELMKAEEPVMELEPVPYMQEVHEINPYDFVDELQIETVDEERNIFHEASLEAGYHAEEATEPYSDGAERSAMLEAAKIESEYKMAEDSVLQFEPSKDSSKEYQQREEYLAEFKMMEPQIHEDDLMMADQPYMEDYIENINLKTNERVAAEKETDQKEQSNNRWRTCNGVVISGKCYQFYRGPMRAADAEFFCQINFPNGHLASVTSSYIHNQMVGLMDRNGGRTRTWIGGLRYLDTGSFIWLDGAHWVYADWLLGEPNNTAGVENCVELLSNGKFNDMPCWDLRAFICSYPF